MLPNKKPIKIPDIIPPRSIVKLIKADNTSLRKDRIGKFYRIGYYSNQDGLDVIWLVDDNGDYCETTDRNFLLKNYKIVKLSKEKDFFGINRGPLRPIKKS